jgi:hypothetical protein
MKAVNFNLNLFVPFENVKAFWVEMRECLEYVAVGIV